MSLIVEFVDMRDTVSIRYESNHIIDWHHFLPKNLR